MTSLAVSSDGLTKRYGGGQLAVDRLDLRVPTGSVYGLLGPNGSGKTTSLRMLLGLTAPTSGRHALLGRRMPEATARVLPLVGALIEGPAFHPHLTGTANLVRLDAADRTVDAASARRRIGDALDRVGLGAAAGKRYRSYSLGMRQRLGVAAALLRPRELLVLDEPTNGLDPQGIREMRHLVTESAAAGATVLLSSHLLGEAAAVCTEVGVMSAGRLVWQGPAGELPGRSDRVRVATADPAAAATVLDTAGLTDVRIEGATATGALGPAEPERVVAALVGAGVGVREFAIDRADLEDAYVGLTGSGFDVRA